jgi:hypothetical protein
MILAAFGLGYEIGAVPSAAINLMAAMWAGLDPPTGWGLADQDMLVVLSIGIGVVLWQKSRVAARLSRSSPA